MDAEPGDRLFAALPAVYREGDASGDLGRLLGVLEALFFTGSRVEDAALPGIERQLPALPALFSPAEGDECEGARWSTPEGFLHWLAAWLAFTPHALFDAEALRRISAGIVPLYGLRGTRDYLLRLLHLCFGPELAAVHLDDRPRVGFTIGRSMVGQDTRLARSRPFWFKVEVELPDDAEPARLEHRLRAVIDFAKPAHTAYELQWRPRPRNAEPPATAWDGRDG